MAVSRRLQKELRDLQTQGTPIGIVLLQADDFQTWKLSIEVLGNTLYQGEKFALRFQFDSSYPITPPAVTFVADGEYNAPMHPHVYSNGHICASILGNEWSPVLTVAAVCITLQSMLASCKVSCSPPDDQRYVLHAPADPRKVRSVRNVLWTLQLMHTPDPLGFPWSVYLSRGVVYPNLTLSLFDCRLQTTSTPAASKPCPMLTLSQCIIP
ncbi:hypothetical protein PHLGIDRAFT_110093 [Phlebiopsis gigantea 11061_1 CR5-6]|uniref:UBC core domain-containing protein n=1 Tax=Phlebiopsis gigantea (strain 11061_1 CR5-6) TaxID=745531 RepID=A0A0C3NH02_PHLG1|nr:hypothetical protein PHLGIDRAFT_110093 [Phlebiopsis gigantea 11061_1 CR5-6]